MTKQTKAAVGASILYFQSGASQPLAGTIASLDADGRVNIAYTDTTGQAQSRQGVAVADEANAAGDYVLIGDDAEGAQKAHAAAAQKAQQGQPAQGQEQTAQQKKDAATARERGDFTSAATAGDNVQAAGSGGPFDPANTAKAHMTVNQTQESSSIGNPTTGGVTPKLSAENMHMLSERDREAAQAIINAKSAAEKTLAANAGTGAATPGTAQMIAHPPAAKTVPPADPAPAQATEESTRLQREEAAHKVAQEKSAEMQRDRQKEAPAKQAAAPEPAKKATKTQAFVEASKKAVKRR
ncbi:MAG: hypothetical protein ABIX12_06260 [Rubrivivax sp.]